MATRAAPPVTWSRAQSDERLGGVARGQRDSRPQPQAPSRSADQIRLLHQPACLQTGPASHPGPRPYTSSTQTSRAAREPLRLSCWSSSQFELHRSQTQACVSKLAKICKASIQNLKKPQCIAPARGTLMLWRSSFHIAPRAASTGSNPSRSRTLGHSTPTSSSPARQTKKTLNVPSTIYERSASREKTMCQSTFFSFELPTGESFLVARYI